VIEIENLIFEYPDKRVIDKLSLKIKDNSITVLVGPNGAGKTTLIKSIAGLTEPYSGHVKIDGLDVYENPVEAHKKMGYLPDFFGLYDALTVRESLFYAAISHGIADEEAKHKAVQAADRLSIAEHLNNLAGDLSRGLKQRLAIAQAIVHEPKFLVLDEPASGLDPLARNELSALFKQLKSQGMTLLVSSHILSELEDYATDMIILKDGEVISNSAFDLKLGENLSTRKIMLRGHFSSMDVVKILEELNVGDIQVNADVVTFVIEDSDAKQVSIVKELFEKEVNILEYKNVVANMKDLYAGSVAAHQNKKQEVK